jgi:hypothetical protein
MKKYIGGYIIVFCVFMMSVVSLVAAVKQPINAITISPHKVISDSGKVWKCDSLIWKSYDTIIPVPKTIFDTIHHKKIDTLKHK